MEYNFKKIEAKWQKYWEDNKTFEVKEDSNKEKYYVLIEFPYPSGVGLHIGHPRSYAALDSLARKRRMEGYNVMFPMGWDAFGLPAENYAIKNKIHPKQAVEENVKTFKRELQELGLSFDWSREVNTTDPEYYKWTQWQFLKFYEHNMAYKAKKAINWCPKCKIGLSNEEATGGVCERCGATVVQKEKEQWMLKMSEYADDLIEGLNDTEFQEKTKLAQINWIGKSVGAEVDFKLTVDDTLKVFTTRPDTLFGATFMVISPEHPIIEKYKDIINNLNEIKEYQKEAMMKTEFERTELTKEKTGVEIKGFKAINPVNNKEIPIWISDYVMMNYGTGAIMAVPAHDDRDYAFATKFGIDIIPVIEKMTGTSRENETYKQSIIAIVYDAKTDKYLTVYWKKQMERMFVGETKKDNESDIEAAIRGLREETGYSDLEYVSSTFPINHHYYAPNKDKNFVIDCVGVLFNLKSDKQVELELDDDEVNEFEISWQDKKTILKEVNEPLHRTVFEDLLNKTAYAGDGLYINSDFLNGLTNKEEAINKTLHFLEERNIGTKKTNYRLQDWVFSRQRFWGEPIPMIHCEDDGWVPVPESDLPVLLPDVANYEPTETGESPLASIPEFVNTTCPKCGKNAKRETDTMPNWAGSSWYWLRYMDPDNKNEFASFDKLNYWGKVDWYNGGMEHAARHLLYARFWNQFLFNIGLVPNKEPFKIRTSHGMILGEDNRKMSKSFGNVVSPQAIIDEMGADPLRVYECFIGDYEHEVAWSTNGLKGCKRFLDRVWKLQDKLNGNEGFTLESSVHKTIKKVGSDIESMKYNTAIASLMTLLNEYEKLETITREDLRIFIHLLNPFAPHITEEINEINNLGKSLCNSSWPIYDEAKTIDDTYEMIVQVNGKVRGKIEVSTDTTEDEMKRLSKEIDNVKTHIEGKQIIKEIVVPKKLVNIVVK